VQTYSCSECKARTGRHGQRRYAKLGPKDPISMEIYDEQRAKPARGAARQSANR
jgi:hypothetical protein